MARASAWERMDAQPRRPMNDLRAAEVPDDPGCYALYRGSKRMYVGKADCLNDRVWKRHSGRGPVMTGSAMRRNVAQHLGIASANDIYKRRYQPTATEMKAVRDWLDGCYIAWLTCATKAEAKALETALKAEYLPPLTKM